MAQTTLKTPARRGLTFQVLVVVEPDGEEFHAYCPALKGLHVAGATIEEAVENARVAAQLFLECLIEDGDPIPIGMQQSPHEQPHPKRLPKEAVHVE
ncbi:MAG: type II toxin-antitoxin system HicB family antitoxin, partial [Candidatus Bipolaricaulota bacterium]|nr:type II toxin-antitoxin system HicB family antitoxin [Candidatus Bipolaricaulota bacterium]